MEPFAPESLSPGVLPDSGLQPVKVAQDRMALEMKANQLGEAAKQAKKAEEQKVKEGFKMPDFGKVYYRHKQAGEQVYNENLLRPLAQIEKNFADNPTNRDLNPNEIGTPAYMQKEKVINDAVQFVKRSADIQAQFDDMLKQYGSRADISPEYLQDLTDWAGSQDALFNGAPAPTPEIYWNEGEAYKNSFGQIQAEKRGSEGPTGTGYTTSVVTETITPDDIKAKAMSVEADPIFRVNLERKVNNLNTAQRAALAAQAKESGMSLLAQQAYNDNIHYAKTDRVQTLQSDATFNNKMGSGWGSDNASMERLADEIISAGDLTSPHWERWPGWSAAGKPKDYKGTNPQAVNKGFNGLSIGKDANGKEVFISEIVLNEDGTMSIIGSNDVSNPAFSKELTRMPAKDFANNIVNTIAENNTDIKREVLERVLKEKGAVTDQGFVKTKSSGPMIPGKKPATQGGAFIP